VLLAHVLGTSRERILAHPELGMSREEISQYAELIERRSRHEPVAYLLRNVEWYGRRYEVTPAVLIPRPETELTFECALQTARMVNAREIADIGTGSGVLAVELARALPDARVSAVDVSSDALEVARRNSEAHGVSGRVRLLRGNLLEALASPPDLVVANLPYLSQEGLERVEPDLLYEPTTALVAGPTGLELYEELFRQARERGWHAACVLEVDPPLIPDLRRLVAGMPWTDIEVFHDYAGLPRIARLLPKRHDD
jgi:release factor glutamine methyltransferase